MALAVRYKRKTADARSRALRRRFYQGAAVATVVYVLLSLVKFHGEFEYLSLELAVIWAVFLLCYTTFREVVRWNEADTQSYRGELWAALVVGGAYWMIVWNILRAWVFHLPTLPFPAEYGAATIETIVLYTLSSISAFLHKHKLELKNAARRYRAYRAARTAYGVAVTAKARRRPVVAKQAVLPAEQSTPEAEAEVKAVLTSAPKKPEEEPPKQS